MNIAIIGAGRLATALGGRLANAGHAITLSSASGTSAEAAAEAIPGATATGTAEAIAHSDLAILAVPFAALPAALDSAGDFAGRVLWSCVNALKPDASGLAAGFDTSAAEQVAALASNARIVAALPPFANYITPGGTTFDGALPAVFCCADDAQAKQLVAGRVREIGAEPVDAGALVASRLVEPAMMLVVALTYSTSPPQTRGLALLTATE
jgi:predicted dinucleotide-binding enzyme